MMPTMLAAALSVIVVLLFSAETWELRPPCRCRRSRRSRSCASASAAFVLYRAFAFDTLLGRDRRITESAS